MRVLLVEDDANTAETLTQSLQAIVGPDGVVLAKSRNSAISVVRTADFDYAVLDLKIPTEDGGLDAASEHGQRVYAEIREKRPGMPLCFCTAFGSEDLVSDLMEQSDRIDIWGSGVPQHMVTYFRKAQMAKLVEGIQRKNAEIAETDSIELNAGMPAIALTPAEKRVLRIFARRQRGASISVRQFSGGLSDSRVVRVDVYDDRGSQRILAVGRLGNLAAIQNEKERYREVVRLPVGRYCNFVDEVRAGAGKNGGLFYRLLDGHDQSLFDMLSNDVDRAVAVVEKLRTAEVPWLQGVGQRRMSIEALRRLLIRDEVLTTQCAEWIQRIPDRQNFEQRDFMARVACQHGDCHGGNILVGPNDDPTFIDFSNVGEAPACLDAISLECSLLWHPLGLGIAGNWPTMDRVGSWQSLDDYTEGCGCREFVRASRRWAQENAAGNREIFAVVYAFALRQLKFRDTNKELAIRMALMAKDEFNRT